MKSSGVEQQHIACLKEDRFPLADQVLVFREILAEEQMLIETLTMELQLVGSGNDPQPAVLWVLGPEGKPQTDKFWTTIRPIPNVLMPASFAAEPGVLGHDTVVVRKRHANSGTEQLLQSSDNGHSGQPLGKDRIAPLCVLESSDGASSRLITRRRGPGIAKVGLEFDRTLSRFETHSGDCEDPTDNLRFSKSANDQEPAFRESGQLGRSADVRKWRVPGTRGVLMIHVGDETPDHTGGGSGRVRMPRPSRVSHAVAQA